MVRIRKSEFALLRSVVAALRDAALYLATDGGRTARKARARLEAKGRPDDAAFFASLYSDLQELGSILESIAESSTSIDENANTAIRNLLIVVQEQYLMNPEHSDSEDESLPDSTFTPLERLLDELDDPSDGPTTAERAGWLCSETKLPKTKSKQRQSLLDMIKKCYVLLKPLDQAYPIESSSEQDDTSTSIWTTPLFTNAEQFHHALSQTWDCTCFADRLHQDAVFSFHATPDSEHCRSAGLMYFRTQENDLVGWKHIRFDYHGQRTSLKALEVAENLCKPTEHDQLPCEHFCDALDCASAGDFIHIKSGSTVLHRRTMGRGSDTEFSEELPLSSCFELPQNHHVYNLSPKRRMMLALYLAYAYLHLSGGCWWPYTVRPSVRFPDKIDPAAPPSAFFAASLLEDSGNQKPKSSFEITQLLNPKMPSLVAFGRLLLELHVGKTVVWDRVKTELKNCEEQAFATQISGAIEACLKSNELGTTEDPCTIRENEQLRSAFIKKVVLPIQHVLQIGYEVTVEDIFPVPSAAKPLGATTPWRMKASITPIIKDIPQVMPAGFCLHDGQDQPLKIDDDSARDADAYMKKLQDCNTIALYSKLCPEDLEGTNIQPVKVAILDTGARISKEQHKRVYEGRLKECRTWLTTMAAEGEQFPPGTSDNDGHGTHGTSVLLQATQNSNIHVYVAQVFSGRHEKLVREQIESDPTIDRIIHAIYYAVNVWKVDVISMSFGFSKRVKAIDEALMAARWKGVLMFAAASNCGANDEVSWPARDDRVICIYASTGIGNKYPRNPNALKKKDNFAVLGTSVGALWPNQDNPVRKSGTSTATPICAAIAAIIISVLRRSEDKYIAASQRPDLEIKSLREDYREKLKVLGRASSMTKVLRRMVSEGGTRDGYDYITPWTMFNKDRSATSIIEDILEAIDA